MKKIAANIGFVVAALIGIALIVYPHIGFVLAQRNASHVAQHYGQAVEVLDKDAIRKELDKAAVYNARLTGDSIEDPFIAGSGMVLPDDYMSILNVDGVMGRVKIPKVDVDLPIHHGTSDATLLKGTGHLEGSSLPVGGEGTHTVITGHTGLSTSKMFTDLIEIKEGDEFYLYVLNQVLAYRVNHIEVVEPEHVEGLRTVAGKDYATLITCTPYGINSHRLLVRGERVPYTPAQVQQRIQETKKVLSQETLLLILSMLALVILMTLLIAANVYTRRKARKAKMQNLHLYRKPLHKTPT